MIKLLLLSLSQSLFLCGGQVLLKLAMIRMPGFTWSWSYVWALLTNGYLALCGVSFAVSGVLWMMILRRFPFAVAYPLAALAYVFGLLAAMFVFHESVAWTQWIGVLLIMAGCALVVQ